MVSKEANVATNEATLAAQRAVSNIHKMQWLKHQNNAERCDRKEEEGGDEMSANARNANKPPRKSRPKNSKHANGQQGRGKNSPTMQPPSNAWESRNRKAADFFQAAEPAEDKDLKRAIEASLSMMQQTNLGNDETDVGEADERTDDDDFWSGKVQKNLPSPVSQEIHKTSDTNNNSSAGRSSVSTSATKVSNRTADRSSARAKISPDDEKGKGVEQQVTIEKRPDQLLCTVLDETHSVDRFNRIDGQNERHMFMGPGARKKEQSYIKQRQQEYERLQQQHLAQQQATSRPSNETPASHQGGNRHDGNRKSLQYSSREPRNSQNPSSRRSSDDSGPRSFLTDKYHYVRGQSTTHSAPAERQSSGDRKKRDIPEKDSSSAADSPGELAEEIEYPARPDVPVDGKTQAAEIPSGPSPQAEKNGESGVKVAEKVLRLTGFNSRFNTPVNDELLDSPKAQTEVSAPASTTFEPHKNHSTEVELASSWRAETPQCTRHPPPGFAYPQLRAVDDFVPNYEPRVSNVYERLAIHDPSLYRFLLQRENENGRQPRAADNSAVREDHWRPESSEKPSSFATPEARVSVYQEKESSSDYPVEARSYVMREEFVPDGRQFPDDSRPDPNFFYANEQAAGVYEDSSMNYSPHANEHPEEYYYFPYPYQAMPSQHPLQTYIASEYSHDDNRVPPETPRLQPRSAACFGQAVFYPPAVPNPRLDLRSHQFDFEDHHYHESIVSQASFLGPAIFPNRFANFPESREFCRPHSARSHGMPLNVNLAAARGFWPRGPRRSRQPNPQQRYIPDTGHGRGRV